MAEYDNVQLYSNYQSYHKHNSNNNDNGLALKRKKINHHYDNETMTALKCQRPNNNNTNNNYCTIDYKHKSAAEKYNNDDSTTTKSSSSSSSSYLNLMISIINRHLINNNNNKCCISLTTTDCIDNNNINNNKMKHKEDDNKFYRLPIRNEHFSCYNKSNSLALLLLIGLLLFKINSCYGFQLEGTENSYAQFRKWYTGLNGTLELEFKTEQPNGLVLYTDDGGTYDFFELKLVEGALRLRYNLGGGAQIITVGRDLHDGHWHKVQVLRNDEHTTLTVDGVSQSKVSRGKEFQFGKFATNSDIFVGGMPAWYSSKLAMLALPSVIFEPRFRGSVRNLVYTDQPGVLPRRQEMRQPREGKCGDSPCDVEMMPEKKVTRGLRNNITDACERHDPCQHGGICISTDSGPLCECRNLEYEGTYCERDKAPSEATFRGTEFLSYDLGQTGGEPIVSAQDAISLYFRTRQPNGLLFFTGHGTDYLNLAIRDGGVSLTMGLANGKQEMHIKPARVRFDDHQWHKVTVHRRIQEISSITSFCRLVVVVDEVYTDHSHIAGKFTILSSSKVYVGGSVNPRALLGARVHNNFVGCLRKVEFSADTLRLNLIDLARTGSKLIQVVGRVDYNCPSGDPQDPVTFTTRDSHLVLPPWEVSKQGVISFKFRTNEPNGMIILATGTRPPRSDFFAVELLNGHIYIHIDLGSGASKVRASRRRVDDGVWHELTVRRSGREGKVGVDGQYNEFKTPGDSTQLELDSPLYIGGTGPSYASVNIPPALWTGTLRQGYVGCLRDLVLSGKPVDIAAYARQQDAAAVKPSCHVQTVQCTPNPCHNGGVCSEGWNRPLCDCSATLYTGPTCGRESATLAFNGSQHLTIWTNGFANQGVRTQTEELVLRFKTSRPTGLLLLTSADTNSPDRLEIALVAGRVRASVRLGEREKNLLAGQGVLNDNNWHTVRFSRRASNLRLQVDGAVPVRGMLSETILGRHSTLEVRSLHLGGLFHAEEEIQMTATMPNFVGQLQGFVYNGHRYIDVVKSLGPELNAIPQTTFKLTARFINSPPGNTYQVATFKSKHSYVGLAMLKAFESISIDFRFKTLEPNGILFFNGGKKNDFICIELVNGHIHYIFDMGDGPVTIRDKSKVHMNDNRWHSVSIRRPGPKIHSLLVDDTLETFVTSGNSMHLKLDGILYIGGVFKDMYGALPIGIATRSGFEGCLASLDLADLSPSLTEDAVVPSSLVVNGCEGPTKCSQNACANRGICVQQWNAYACECDMTSFTGPTCYDESVAYEFGAGRGLIQYQFPPGNQPDTEEDNIALGFITLKTDAVLLRIESANTQDYFELEIVEGNIFAVFNIGSQDLPLGEIGVKVNDNNYHVVRFTRRGGNATLQIDDYNVQNLHAQGHISTMFNSMGNIQVGGKVPKGASRSRIERPFAGVIAGLSINRLRILDLAAERDPQITIRGDVQLVTGVLDRNEHLQRMQQTPPSGYPGVMDDLIFSGAGSGCRGDDEDECMPPFENGSGDDLITPVYVPPTKQTTTQNKTKPGKGESEKLCDDEDCLHGSGSGEVTDTYSTTSVTSKTDVKDTSPDFSSSTTTDDRRTDTTISETTRPENRDDIIRSSGGTTGIHETTHPQTSSSSAGTSTTVAVVSSSLGTSTSLGTSSISSSSSSSTSTTGTSAGTTTTTTTRRTTPYIPPQTDTTIPYKVTDPPEPSTPEEEFNNEIVQPDDTNEDYDNEKYEAPIPQPETEPPPPVFRTPAPRDYNHRDPSVFRESTRSPPKNKHGRINSEAEERTAMIIGIVAGALIAVILVILLVLWIKSNGDRSYKMEHDLKYGHGANAALLGHNSGHHSNQHHHGSGGTAGGGANAGSHHGNGAGGHHGHHNNQQQQQQQHHNNQQPYQHGNGYGSSYGDSHEGVGGGHQSPSMGGVNGSLRQQQQQQQQGGHYDRNGASAGLVQPKAKRNSKDIKEWYV